MLLVFVLTLSFVWQIMASDPASLTGKMAELDDVSFILGLMGAWGSLFRWDGRLCRIDSKLFQILATCLQLVLCLRHCMSVCIPSLKLRLSGGPTNWFSSLK